MVVATAKNKLIRLYKKNYNPPHSVKFYLGNGHCFYTNIVSQIVRNDNFYIVPKYAKKFSLSLNVFKSNLANSKLIPTFRISFYDKNRKKVYVMMSQRFRQSKLYRFMKKAFYYQIDICAFRVDKRALMDCDCDFEFAGNGNLDAVLDDDSDSVISNASMDCNSNYSISSVESYESYNQKVHNIPTTATINDETCKSDDEV